MYSEAAILRGKKQKQFVWCGKINFTKLLIWEARVWNEHIQGQPSLKDLYMKMNSLYLLLWIPDIWYSVLIKKYVLIVSYSSSMELNRDYQ